MNILPILIIVAFIFLFALLVWCYGSRMRISVVEIDAEIAKLESSSNTTIKDEKIKGLNTIKEFIPTLESSKKNINFYKYRLFTWLYDEYVYNIIKTDSSTDIETNVNRATYLNNLVELS